MRRYFFFLLIISLFFASCHEEKENLYTVGIFQINDAPTLNAVRKGFIQALEENGLFDRANIRLIFRNGMGSIPEVQRIAGEFVAEKVNMIVAFSTPCLQAALHASREIPIIFSSVANPYLAGAGRSDVDHLSNVSGVSSKGPIKESLAFIKEVLPHVKKIGTLWTPAELNSKFYLDLAEEGASDLGLEIIAVPIANSSEVLLAAQILISKKIDAIYQISDNTINASFEAVGKVAEENSIPLFGGFPPHTLLGACAALGWDFVDMGYKAGQIACQVKNGKNPSDIPFQFMSEVKLHINLKAAAVQGVEFSNEILKKADEIIGLKENSSDNLIVK